MQLFSSQYNAAVANPIKVTVQYVDWVANFALNGRNCICDMHGQSELCSLTDKPFKPVYHRLSSKVAAIKGPDPEHATLAQLLDDKIMYAVVADTDADALATIVKKH